ncbi:MAG: DoxX family protein [Methylacidiphilales bacterium]|nr:DoxX family protein [Candidatus Methylacidiphilales bacterium]
MKLLPQLIFFISNIKLFIFKFDWIAPLLCRIYLVPIFWSAGIKKFNSFESIVYWFGEGGLDLPAPQLMAFLATASELVGAIFLTLGFATRLICIPLSFTMIVAAVTVHWQYGWQAILDPGSPFAPPYADEGIERLEKAREILDTHGNYDWLTETGNLVILNNGIEFAATYLLLLIVLITIGGGRYVSADYWIFKAFVSYYQRKSG